MTPRTGSVRLQDGRWYARVSVAPKQRVSVALVTCTGGPADEEKARERGRVLSDLAQRLRKGGHEGLVRGFLDRAAGRDGRALQDVLMAAERLCAGEAAAPISAATTVQELGEQWTSGKLHERWPDHIRKKKSASDDAERLRLYVYPIVGRVPLPEFSISHADLVMSSLPARLSPASRRHVAQALARVLKLAAYPARIIAASPLPAGFLPPMGKRKALSFLYPDEDRRLLASREIPLPYRLFYGFLSREGMRRSEAGDLTWGDLDLARGAVTLDENKSDDPRAWALDPSVVRALVAWRELCGEPRRGALVFVDENGRSVADRGNGKGCPRLRAHLRLAGVDRSELFERSAKRQPIRIHDLRATFITVGLANGRTETWIADRTGHRSSTMINRYRRAARRVGELGLGDLAALDEAIPELGEAPEGPHGGGPDGGLPTESCPSEEGISDGQIGGGQTPREATASSNADPDRGDSRDRTRTGTPLRTADFESEHPAVRGGSSGDPMRSRARDATDRDESILLETLRILLSGTRPRAVAVRVLGVLASELAAAGDVAAARVAHSALGRLLGAAEDEGEGADVVDLEERRRG